MPGSDTAAFSRPNPPVIRGKRELRGRLPRSFSVFSVQRGKLQLHDDEWRGAARLGRSIDELAEKYHIPLMTTGNYNLRVVNRRLYNTIWWDHKSCFYELR